MYPYVDAMSQTTSSSQATPEDEHQPSKEISESNKAGNDPRKPAGGSNETFEQIILETVQENPYDLSYTCLLIPRFASDFLLGDIATSLQSWLEQICSSFGWRLEFLSIRADYLHWTVRVPPATSTAFFMQVIREQTSRQIFAEFPRFQHKNPANDFWATGYLIFWGSQPHPKEVIQRFIQQTRQHQVDRLDE